MYYKNGQIEARPKIPVSNPKPETYRKHGWIPFEQDRPEFDRTTHKLEKADIEVGEKAVQTYNVIQLTPEEIESRIPETEKIRAEIEARINGIADLIGSGLQGKALADEIRK